MKTSRFKYQYRSNASKLHKKIGDLLRYSDSFKYYDSFQEYPVNKVNTRYYTGCHHFDWVIPGLRLVVECHGIQHYEPTAFDGDNEKAIDQFYGIQERDDKKKTAALDAGFKYITISYKEEKKICELDLLKKITAAEEELSLYQSTIWESLEPEEWKAKAKEVSQKKRKDYLASDTHKRYLSKQREANKKLYQALKEKKNETD